MIKINVSDNHYASGAEINHARNYVELLESPHPASCREGAGRGSVDAPGVAPPWIRGQSRNDVSPASANGTQRLAGQRGGRQGGRTWPEELLPHREGPWLSRKRASPH